jgi:hypothetical protein
VYQLGEKPSILNVEANHTKLVYWKRGSSMRTSYDQLKGGLVKKNFSVEKNVPDWL